MQGLFHRPFFREALIFGVLTAGMLLLAFRINFPGGKARSTGVFHSDKSIYYVYLPATFIYGWDARKFPSQCDTLYRGFILDGSSGKVVAKMTCGVALMWTPFFLVTHAAAVVFDQDPDGFSDLYQRMAVVPPVLFFVAGLFFLRRFLLRYFSSGIVWITLLTAVCGTNLLYYGLAEGLMSHVHSFFLFSLFLFLWKRFLEGNSRSERLFAAASFVFALAVLVRPTNVILFLAFLLLDARSLREAAGRIRLFLQPVRLVLFVCLCLIVFLPQMIYWKYLTGSFLHYSYGGERFTNWNGPVILPLLFSPFNGLFPYSPAALLFIAGSLWMAFRRKMNGVLGVVLFALTAYISGSWHMWFFGGSFGSRPFVEYFAVLAPGLAFLLERLRARGSLLARSVLALALVAAIGYTLRLTLTHTWYSGSVWDWDAFRARLEQAGIFRFSHGSVRFVNDFENTQSDPALEQTTVRSHSFRRSARMDPRHEFAVLYDRGMQGLLDQPVRHASARLMVSADDSTPTRANLVASVETFGGHVWLYQTVAIDSCPADSRGWREVELDFPVPEWLTDPANRIKVYLWNHGRTPLLIDDFSLTLE